MSIREGHELSQVERQYANGTEPQLLDRIQITLQNPVQHDYQVENHLIDPAVRWVKTGTFAWHDLDNFIEAPNGRLWIDGDHSYNGLNDRIPLIQAPGIPSSLRLVEVEGLNIVVALEGINPRRVVRGHFSFGGTNYALRVTDPVAEATYFAQGEGGYPIALARICISVGEPYEGHCYKLVAGIITP